SPLISCKKYVLYYLSKQENKRQYHQSPLFYARSYDAGFKESLPFVTSFDPQQYLRIIAFL
ncbi:hypothetical protein, partial [Synechococcus sp. UW179B]|uniref:hypothetical protein n=1 Tax=Synechococcus sp. UW179B TaxID=2575516 RepID=UPI001A7E114F